MELVSGALRLDAATFSALIEHARGLRISLSTVFLAGLSVAMGQSVVLFASRVSPARFVASLVLSASLFVGVFLVWTASIWLVALYGFGSDRPFEASLIAVGLAFAPQLFGFFVLVPYFGSGIGVLLSAWNLLAIALATQVAFEIGLPQAVVCAAAGWALLQVTQRTVGWPLARLARWARSAVAGQRLQSLDDLIEQGRQ